jgi:hypothetical protein
VTVQPEAAMTVHVEPVRALTSPHRLSVLIFQKS